MSDVAVSSRASATVRLRARDELHEGSVTPPGRYLLLGSSVALGALALANVLGPARVLTDWPSYIAMAFLVWFSIYLFATYRAFGSMYLFASAYVICLAAFHLGHVAVHVTGLGELPYLVTGDMAPWHEVAAWYCLLAYAAFGIGLSLAMKVRAPVPAATLSLDRLEQNLSSAFWIGVALLLAATAALLLTVGSVGNILRFSRAEIFGGVGDTRGYGYFLMVAPSAAVLLCVGANTVARRWFAYSMAALLALTILFLGYRSSVLFPALLGAVLWVKLGRRIPLGVVVVGVIIVAIAIPSVRYLRAQGPYQDVTREDVQQALSQASEAQSALLEIGGVSTVVAYVVKTVPQEWPYRWGQSYWLALKTAIPNFGSGIADSEREAVSSAGLSRDMLSEMHPADWYTFVVDRWMFDTGGGAGFSTIAEAYLNFGTWGVIGFFTVLGFGLGRLDRANMRADGRALVGAGALLWPLLKTVRNTFGVFVKPLVFILLTIVVWKLATSWMGRKQ